MTWSGTMKSWLPEMWYAQAFRALALLDAEGDLLDDAEIDVATVREARLPQTSDEWGIARFEDETLLGLRPELSLEERRARVLAQFRGVGSTLARLKTIASTWQYGDVDIVADPETATIYVTFTDIRGIPASIEDHQIDMRSNVQAHLGIEYRYTYLLWGEPKQLAVTWGDLKTATITWGALKVMKADDLP